MRVKLVISTKRKYIIIIIMINIIVIKQSI